MMKGNLQMLFDARRFLDLYSLLMPPPPFSPPSVSVVSSRATKLLETCYHSLIHLLTLSSQHVVKSKRDSCVHT